ncbi:PTS transporter subunit EIIC [Carnobacterium gallinarum]|uniref:PTS transporter subunit EIIC n=1 Tax=Carnobacterium gallinarum TaxID=2749 RepID=UPI001B80E257|nr:PTS transporter subunit EIIC [Carnobacterium gallinarum]
MKNIIRKIKFNLSKLGEAMLVPIVAMPVAGLLSRFGQPDLLDLQVLRMSADVVFSNLDLLFAVGMILAFTKTKDKSIPVLAAVLSIMVFKNALTYFNEDLSMGVFAGIATGGLVSYLYEKSRLWKTPNAFNLFTGEKFILTLGPIAMIPYAFFWSLVWAPIENGLDGFALWMGAAGILGVALFGFLNRLLIPTGLHHVLNAYIFYQLGSYVSADGTKVTGEVARFLAGDPTAGTFMSMFFVIMVFGLPGACLGMYQAAKPEQKKSAKGLLSSGGITSFFSGTTEPVEFTFMFSGPQLYLLHSFLTGLAGAILYLTGTKLGFAFGFNIFDLVLNWQMGTNVIFIPLLGIAYFFIYWFSFKFIILKFDLKTPGRQDFVESMEADDITTIEKGHSLKNKDYDYLSKKILQNVGGATNVVSASNCATRLRLVVKDSDLVDSEKIKQLNVLGVVKLSKENVQVIIGPEVRHVAESFNAYLDLEN